MSDQPRELRRCLDLVLKERLKGPEALSLGQV